MYTTRSACLRQRAVLFVFLGSAVHGVLFDLGSVEAAAFALRDSEPRTPRRFHFDPSAKWPYTNHHTEREDIGERLFALAAVPETTVKKCGGFLSFGGYTWCAKAMPAPQSDMVRAHTRDLMAGIRFYNSSSDYTEEVPLNNRKADMYDCSALGCPTNSKDFLSLSYGIEHRDMWSEMMGNIFGARSKLYDCFAGFDNVGPMGNDSFFAKDLGLEKCPTGRHSGTACYNLPYEKKKVCLGSESGIFRTSNKLVKKEAESIHDGLKNLAPLSVFLKMDVEGHEFDALEQLLANDDDLRKIRTIDMEVHMNILPNYFERDDGSKVFRGFAQPPIGEVERRARIMERLAEKFVVVGTNIDYLHKVLHKTMEKHEKAGTLMKEPIAAYTKTGYSLDQYMISLVNPALL